MNQEIRKPKTTDKGSARTASKEVRRMQLIDATINSISKHGISGTTMNTVTDYAGLSQGIVNFHFDNKQNLFEETLVFLAREHHDQWQKAFKQADLSATAKLLAIVDAHFNPKICSRKKLSVWFAFYGEAGRRRAYRQRVDSIDDERFDVTIGLIDEIIAEGGYNEVNARLTALTLEGMYDGLCLNILLYPEDYSRAQAKVQIRTYLASVFPEHFERPPPL